MRHEQLKSSEWRDGWRPLAAGFLAMAVGWNFALVVSGLFVKPMAAEFGWSRAELSFGPLAGLIVAVLLLPVGAMIDRVGARFTSIVGICGLAVAYLLFAALPPSRGLYYGAIICFSLAGALSTSVSFSRMITPWFHRNLGLAIGLMMAGASAGVAVMVPALSQVVAAWGWRMGFVALSGSTLVVGLPLMLLWFHEPTRRRPSLGAALPLPRSIADLLSTAGLWQLAGASAVAALPIGGFLANLIPLLTDRGLSAANAAGLVSLFAAAVAVGRLTSGWLLDRFDPPRATATMLALAAGGAAMLLYSAADAPTWAMLAVAIALVGLAQGAEGDYIMFFSMRMFGLADYSRVVSFMAFVISAGMAAGGVLFARVYDATGSYDAALGAAIACYLLAAGIFLTIRVERPGDSGSGRGALRTESIRLRDA